MTDVQSSETIRAISRSLGLSQGHVVNVAHDKIQPTVEGNILLVKPAFNINNDGTGNFGIWTTPADQDFYLCSIVLSWTKNVVSTATTLKLYCKIGGAFQNLLEITRSGVTVSSADIVVCYPRPLKIDRNNDFNISLDHEDGTQNIGVCMTGFVDESSKVS